MVSPASDDGTAPASTYRAPEGGMSSPDIFVVGFEHAHRAFRCIRLDASADGATPAERAHWLVTLEGRTVWSFDARDSDTRESVQRDVEQWWDRSAR